ncbi:YqhR family membrane protein [Brevibacillus migulae]|uniref:YqhR family membrane protein n=1 Tax=Brevibacillus migulae TaxID=1644114 RepID=UPI00106E882B|nr:YqhR family membrane protein [Brevibacillus migulae]
METAQSRYDASEKKETREKKAWRKIVEVGFWGTVMWGILRMIAHFLGFTPYSNRSFSRPLLGLWGEHNFLGTIVGIITVFLLATGAAAIYSLFVSRIRLWWGGLVYGFGMFLVFGFFFRMGNWQEGTISTELAWFLSFGLFIGMTILAEKTEEE